MTRSDLIYHIQQRSIKENIAMVTKLNTGPTAQMQIKYGLTG